ncbi:hypothetical protein ABT408_38100, partial [Streptomyces halstedii]
MEHTATGAPRPHAGPVHGPPVREPGNPDRRKRKGERSGQGPGEAGTWLREADQPGLFQTPDYARHLFEQNAEFRQTPRDIEAAV